MDSNNQPKDNTVKVALIAGIFGILVALITVFGPTLIKKDEPAKDVNLNIKVQPDTITKVQTKAIKTTPQKNRVTTNKVIIKGNNKGTINQADHITIDDINN
jgi:hypothetical protein